MLKYKHDTWQLMIFCVINPWIMVFVFLFFIFPSIKQIIIAEM